MLEPGGGQDVQVDWQRPRTATTATASPGPTQVEAASNRPRASTTLQEEKEKLCELTNKQTNKPLVNQSSQYPIITSVMEQSAISSANTGGFGLGLEGLQPQLSDHHLPELTSYMSGTCA